jgi:hypothetical protein
MRDEAAEEISSLAKGANASRSGAPPMTWFFTHARVREESFHKMEGADWMLVMVGGDWMLVGGEVLYTD